MNIESDTGKRVKPILVKNLSDVAILLCPFDHCYRFKDVLLRDL